MLKWIFYRKVEGPRYTWYFPRKWIKWVGLESIAEVKRKR